MPIPFQPSLPAAPCFDAARNAWILSRYADVSAALRETSLCQATANNQPTTPDENTQHSRLAADVQADIARMSTEEWRTQMDETLSSLIQQAKPRSYVDLVREIIHPWATTMLVNLNGGRAFHSRRLAQISERLFYGPTAEEESPQSDDELTQRRSASEAELNRMLDDRQLMLSKSMFFGLTQTLPSFLAKAWLALLEHPDQIAKLVDDPKSMSNATEELQRYAGVVHTLYRRSTRDLRIGDIDVKEGQLVILELDSANFDPEKFEYSDRMDVTRRATGIWDWEPACTRASDRSSSAWRAPSQPRSCSPRALCSFATARFYGPATGRCCGLCLFPSASPQQKHSSETPCCSDLLTR
jgi:cytochrome P450